MCLFQLSDGFDNFYTKSGLEKRWYFFLGNTVYYEYAKYQSKSWAASTPAYYYLATVYCTCMRVKEHFRYNIFPLNISQKVLLSEG